MNAISQLFKNESGATSVEYAILLAAFAAMCFAAIYSGGEESQSLWQNNSDEVQTTIKSAFGKR